MREEKMLEKAVVFDIDGTLCDDTSRRKEYLTKGDWKNYLLDCQNSRPVECTRVLLDYYLHKGFKAIFVTGRPEALRTKTNHFLTSLGLRINQYELLMREDGNTDSEAVLKRKFMSMLVGAYDIETALDCRPEVREVYKSLQISSGSLFDIDYPPYSLKEELANDDRPFSPRYNFRQRVEDYCAQRFGLWRWEEIRDELLTHFNSKGKEFTYRIVEDGGKYLFFSRELLMKRETKLSEFKRHWIPGRTSYKSLAIHIDELPEKVNDRNLYYADAWIPPDGIRDVILTDGKKAEATFTDEKGWDSPVARFFASDGETVKHVDIEEYNYVPDADDDLKHEAFEKLSPRIKQVLERIRLITRAGKFTFEEFAAEVIDPQTGKVYPKYQTNLIIFQVIMKILITYGSNTPKRMSRYFDKRKSRRHASRHGGLSCRIGNLRKRKSYYILPIGRHSCQSRKVSSPSHRTRRNGDPDWSPGSSSCQTRTNQR